MAVHDEMDDIYDIHQFLINVPPKRRDWDMKLRKLLKSAVFKQGRLYQLKRLVPQKLECKQDLVRFIKENSHLSQQDIGIICSALTKKNWKKWLREAQEEKQIIFLRRGWQ
jgi:hypothetical protein